MRDRILIQGGCVLTLDRSLGDFQEADVLIEGSRVVAVGPNLAVADAEVVDARHCIVMPGFVDTHRHLWQGALRNIAADATLDEYFVNILGTLAPVYRPEDAYIGDLVSALGALNAGITTVLDWSHIQNTPEHADAVIRALQESGIRAVFGYGPPNTSLADWWLDSPLPHPEDIRRLRTQYFSSEDQLLTLCLAARGPEFTTFEVAEHDWRLARELEVRISVHVGVSIYGRRGRLERMGHAGLLGPDTTYIHCCTLNDAEWKMIADTGGTVSIAGPIEMLMGHGLPPVQKALDHGIRPSLSVDVETTVGSDMFSQMRSVMSLQRALIHERRLAGEQELPRLLTARDVVELATIEGARALGLDHKIGTLTPGKEADLIVLRADSINVIPVNSAYGAVVSAMDTSNVEWVFVAGRPVKRKGQLVGVDWDRVRRLVTESRDYLVAKSGFRLPEV